jgi:hypothetical protein
LIRAPVIGGSSVNIFIPFVSISSPSVVIVLSKSVLFFNVCEEAMPWNAKVLI